MQALPSTVCVVCPIDLMRTIDGKYSQNPIIVGVKRRAHIRVGTHTCSYNDYSNPID